MVVGKQRTRNLDPLRPDIDRTMAEPKPLTYDEQKAAEAAFIGAPSNPEWTDSARLLYARLLAAKEARSKEGVGLAPTRPVPSGTPR